MTEIGFILVAISVPVHEKFTHDFISKPVITDVFALKSIAHKPQGRFLIGSISKFQFEKLPLGGVQKSEVTPAYFGPCQLTETLASFAAFSCR